MAITTQSLSGTLRRHVAKGTISLRLILVTGLIALFVVTPLIYIFIRALGANPEDWQRLLQMRIWRLMGNTLLLTVTVTLGTLVIGVSMAWLTERTDLPGRKVFRWMLALPLAIPAYIGAVIHLTLLRPRGGLIAQWLEGLFGVSLPLPSPLGFGGTVFILTIFMFPYVYLLSGAAFRTQHAALEEAARTLGRTPWQIFWQVTLPAMRPGLLAGALLVMLDVLAEYGTVALLRYETFSSAIFVQLYGRYDRSAASILSAVLVTIAMLVLWAEIKAQGQARFTQIESSWRPAPLIALGKWKPISVLLVLGVISVSLLVPLFALVTWSIQAILDAETFSQVIRAGSQSFMDFAWNSLWTSVLAALLTMILALPVARLSVRYPGRITRFLSRLCQVGYAIPGVVIALSLVMLINRFLPFLYATPFLLVIAYTLRHMPQAIRAAEAAMNQVSVSLEEASRTLGRSSARTFLQITLPLIMPGLLAGGALVFLTSLKELPATLLLRPAGFDTLAVKVWMWANEGFYVHAAPAALSLILISMLPLSFILRREQMFK